MRNWIIVAFVALLVVGCKSTETQPAAPIDEQTAAAAAAGAGTGPGGASTSGAGTSGVSGTPAGGTMSPLKDPKNILSKRIVYFDFDSFAVKDEFRGLVDAHAKYLQANRGARMTLQGHADERGSREYNIALGQKRADAVKRMMTLLGVRETIVESVSFGEEKPKNMGHDEGSWAENRRVDIIYVGE